MKPVELHYNTFGEGEETVLILHGLFGMSDNWKTFSRLLSEHFKVITLDLRNHGRSAHLPDHNYPIMAEDVGAFIREHELKNLHLIGHSMGGKVAMELSLSAPELLKSLVVIDIAPVQYEGGHEHIIETMQALSLEAYDKRSDISDFMEERLEDQAIVQFLMKNLKRNKEGVGFKWKFNLEALTNHYQLILAGISSDYTFFGPTTFIKGENSNYITTAYEKGIVELFPSAEVIEIEGAGHWVHADQPMLLLECILDHIENTK